MVKNVCIRGVKVSFGSQPYEKIMKDILHSKITIKVGSTVLCVGDTGDFAGIDSNSDVEINFQSKLPIQLEYEPITISFE